MSTPSRFKKDKEIIAEYESQVKGLSMPGRAHTMKTKPAVRCSL
uniref:SRGAP1/PPM1H fusion protein n=1 Tax=Homo sapiens TaxID=9606 RepID=S5ZYJ2_HUMAN|nr:SRGAP1/PPM1H fusion protein [Homo sapiens]